MTNSEAVAYATSTIEREIDSFFAPVHGETALQMDERVKLLALGLRRLVEFDSFEFESPGEGVFVSLGNPAAHRCNYRITDEGIESAQFTLTRNKQFTEEELVTIETAMASLINDSHL